MSRNRILVAFSLTLASAFMHAGELPVDMQAKLLKIIASGAGSTKVACREDALKAALEGAGVGVDGAAKIAWTNSPGEVRMLKSTGRLVVCGRQDLLTQGAGIAIVEDGGRPKIMLNSMNIKASGVQISDAILKAASI